MLARLALNAYKNLVSGWEHGSKKPGGTALRLLALIQKKGLWQWLDGRLAAVSLNVLMKTLLLSE